MTTLTTDILVVGGGISGYAAAMAASEKKEVILADQANILGGATTLSNVGTLCGFYYRGDKPHPIPHPFCSFFVDELFKKDPAAKILSLQNKLHVISYEWSNLQSMLSDHLHSRGITLSFNTKLVEIKSGDGSISTAVFLSNGEQISTHCKQVIDCTGNGAVATRVNHPMIAETSYQSSAQIFRLSGVKALDEFSLSMSIKKALMKKSETGLNKSYLALSIVPGSLRDGHVDLKLPLATAITDETSLAALADESERALPEILQIIGEISSLTNASIEEVFPLPGIRIQQRPSGKTVLTAEDVLKCRKATDGIGMGTWPVEEWDSEGKLKMEFFNEDDGYTISANCLQSNDVKNLWFAGKGISAEARAIASARVTGTCLQTGYAAGKLATCNNKDERNSFIKEIQSSFSR